MVGFVPFCAVFLLALQVELMPVDDYKPGSERPLARPGASAVPVHMGPGPGLYSSTGLSESDTLAEYTGRYTGRRIAYN